MTPSLRHYFISSILRSILICAAGGLVFVGSVHAQTAGSKSENSGESKITSLLKEAQRTLDAGQVERAGDLFRRIILDFPNSPLQDSAYLGLGEVAEQQSDLAAATLAYQTILENFPKSNVARNARQRLAGIYLERGDLTAALPLLEAARGLETDPSIKAAMTDRIIEILMSQGDRVRVLENILNKRTLTDESGRQSAMEEALRVIDGATPEQLEEMVRRWPGTFPADHALIRLSELDEARGSTFEIENSLKRFLAMFPTHAYADRARTRLEELKRSTLMLPTRIGVLVPLSGPMRQFGREVLNGVRLALDQSFVKGVGLVVRDTEAGPGALKGAWNEMVEDFRPLAIVGPVLSRQVSELAPFAQREKIPMISPAATATNLPQLPFLIRYALTSERQAQALADYAMTRLSMSRFAVLFPNNPYGRQLSQFFVEAVRARGGELVAVETYEPGAADYSPQISRIKASDLASFGVLGPPPEKKGQIQEYTPGFDGMFIPGDVNEVTLIASQLAFFDIRNVRLLGANGWGSADLIRIGGRYVENGLFVDGFFAGSSDAIVKQFTESYRGTYRGEPTLLAAQAFDATRIILRTIENGARTGEQVQSGIATMREFRGPTGVLRVGENGTLIRSVFYVTIQNGRFVEVQ